MPRHIDIGLIIDGPAASDGGTFQDRRLPEDERLVQASPWEADPFAIPSGLPERYVS